MYPQADRPHIEIRPASFRDALTLVLRRADREEVEALSGRNPREALVESVEQSSSAWTGLADGKLVCCFGVTPLTLIGVTGTPWLVGSDEIYNYRIHFLRRNHAYIAEMLWQFPILRNVVDARNTLSVRWLRRLGFRLGEPTPMGLHGEPFIPFEMVAP